MPRYRFHLYDRSGFVEDEDGIELDGIEEARAVALKGARSIIAQDVREGRLYLDGRIEVVDGDDAPVLTVQFRDAAGGG